MLQSSVIHAPIKRWLKPNKPIPWLVAQPEYPQVSMFLCHILFGGHTPACLMMFDSKGENYSSGAEWSAEAVDLRMGLSQPWEMIKKIGSNQPKSGDELVFVLIICDARNIQKHFNNWQTYVIYFVIRKGSQREKHCDFCLQRSIQICYVHPSLHWFLSRPSSLCCRYSIQFVCTRIPWWKPRNLQAICMGWWTLSSHVDRQDWLWQAFHRGPGMMLHPLTPPG